MKSILRRLIRKAGWDMVSFDPRFNFESRKPELLSRLEIKHVLDVGANIGQFARYLRSMKFGGRITSFEPLPDAFRELLRTMGGDVNWNGVNSAVGATSGTIQINVSHNSVSSSIRHVEERHLEAHPDSAISRVETVQLVSLNEYLIQNPDSVGPYMLKADTQGFEDAVLDGANLPGWPIPLVVLEMSIEPLYRGQVLMPDLITRMSGLGYRLAILEPSDVDYSDLSLLQMDGWFVRRAAK